MVICLRPKDKEIALSQTNVSVDVNLKTINHPGLKTLPTQNASCLKNPENEHNPSQSHGVSNTK